MFYTFSQNNSGGSFVINQRVAPHVIIEAFSAKEANNIAEELGIYFDGVQDDIDCSCCGDRWYPQSWDDSGTHEPLVYGSPPNEVRRVCVPKGAVNVIVYYANGKKVTFK